MMFGTQEPFGYFLCGACETLQIVDALEGDELVRHYPPAYHSSNAGPAGIFRWLIAQHDHFKLRSGGRILGALASAPLPDGFLRAITGGDVIKMIAQLGIAREMRILDVGCGAGALLERLARVGFTNLVGVDIFIAADGETPSGVPLLKRDLSEVIEQFDLIMLNHSLEHVPDPIATLKLVREKLSVGGICLARVPTTSSDAWDIYQADWVQIDAPRHTVIPSRRGMELAADRAGFLVEKTFDDSTLGQFMGSEAYRRGIAVTDPKMFRMFGPKQIWAWERRADALNREDRGDQAGFVLRAN
ncbi:class I SAM-dependent methyltransferase [Mycolicibacterium celeriflavum]|uniref:class I SAM-dependent methyltransferase n=1 Tax=Mycolicibacterium celeriflavum TaxID=1249101 RepID=UPI003CF8E9FD